MGLEETIVAELSTLRGRMDEVIAWNAGREKAEKELHDERMAMLRSIQDDVKSQGQQLFEIAGAKTIASQAARDIDEHKKDHRWWFGTVIGLAATISGGVVFIIRNASSIATFLANYGKPPHPGP